MEKNQKGEKVRHSPPWRGNVWKRASGEKHFSQRAQGKIAKAKERRCEELAPEKEIIKKGKTSGWPMGKGESGQRETKRKVGGGI